MKTKLLFSLVAVCAFSFVSTALAKPIPTVEVHASSVQPVRKATISTEAVPHGGVELLRTGDPIDYVSIVVEQDSTSGELEQRLRIDQHTGVYSCRPLPGEQDERCCSESLSQKLRLHRIQANSVFNSEQVDLHGMCYMTVDQGGNQTVQQDPLFGGQELHALTSYNWQYLNLTNAVDGTELRFDNDGCLGVGCADFEKTVSNHDVDALIALGGQDLNMLLLEKGIPEGRVAGIVDGLRDIVDSPLWPYRYWVDIDANGIVHLNYPAYQQGLIFYEQIEAGSDKNDPNYDYADASYWFWVMCGDLTEETIAPPQEVVIRDSIGPDSTMTENGVWVNNHSKFSTSFAAFPVFRFEGGSNGLTISSIEYVMRSVGGFIANWPATQFDFRVWSSEEAVDLNPFQGDVVNSAISVSGVPQLLPGTNYDNRVAKFVLPNEGYFIPPGEDVFLAVVQTNPNLPNPGALGVPQSSDPGQSDLYLNSSGVGALGGRVGVRITVLE